MKVRRDDRVVIIAGKDRGKKGRVLSAQPEKDRIVVEGVNMVKKAKRPTQREPQGGFAEQESSLSVSNVMLVCPSCSAATRVGYRFESDGSKVRVCKKCGAEVIVKG